MTDWDGYRRVNTAPSENQILAYVTIALSVCSSCSLTHESGPYPERHLQRTQMPVSVLRHDKCLYVTLVVKTLSVCDHLAVVMIQGEEI